MMYWLTGALLILLPIVFNVAFFMLGRLFEYPDILRQPTDAILTKFRAGGSRLIAWWYVFTFTAILFAPLAVFMSQILVRPDAPYLPVAMVIGILASLTQFLGLIRWVFLVPYLAASDADPKATPATREAIAVVFQAFHHYAGVAVGEHLGYLFTGVWTLLIAIAMVDAQIFPAWLGWLGLVPALGILFGLLEAVGVKIAGAVNALSYIVWSVWLIAAGVILILH